MVYFCRSVSVDLFRLTCSSYRHWCRSILGLLAGAVVCRELKRIYLVRHIKMKSSHARGASAHGGMHARTNSFFLTFPLPKLTVYTVLHITHSDIERSTILYLILFSSSQIEIEEKGYSISRFLSIQKIGGININMGKGLKRARRIYRKRERFYHNIWIFRFDAREYTVCLLLHWGKRDAPTGGTWGSGGLGSRDLN